jgi:hypothetical protein
MKQLIKKDLGWKDKCLYDSRYEYKIVRVFDHFGFIIRPLFFGATTITSTETYTDEIEAYKAAFKTIHPDL